MAACQSAVNKGKFEGKYFKSRTAAKRLLLRGLISIPDIADAIEMPMPMHKTLSRTANIGRSGKQPGNTYHCIFYGKNYFSNKGHCR